MNMTTFDVEVVLKGADRAVTEKVVLQHGEPGSWDEAAAHDALAEILRAIERVQNPKAPRDRAVNLLGFSWIVEPEGEQVVIAIEIPMGAAVAGPFKVDRAKLDALLTKTIQLERMKTSSTVIH